MPARFQRLFRLVLILTLGISLLSWSNVRAVSAGGLAQAASDAPEIEAAEAIVVEYPSGRILYSKNAHVRMAPASLTKILTAILAIEYGDLNEVVTASPDDLVGESSMGLSAGEQQTLHNLLYGMLLPSGNDAAMAIARHLGSKLTEVDPGQKDPVARFAEMMNVRARQLGLEDSHFVNPHGLDTADHYSSAYDLASLSWYALHLPVFNEVVGTVGYDAPGHSLLNTNEMLTRYAGADGVKTGWTDGCGLCLVTSATRDGHRLISVVLNAPRWYSDSTALLDYGFSRLVAAPTDSTAEVLSISKRDTVSWLLVNASSAPPIAVPAASLAQGGGAPAAPADTHPAVSAPAAPKVEPQVDTRTADKAAPVGAVAAAGTTGRTSGMLLVYLALGIVGIVCMVLASRLWGFRPLAILQRGRQMSLVKVSPEAAAPGIAPRVPHAAARPLAQISPASAATAAPRTLGSLTTSRRREPNLLLVNRPDTSSHVERAVALGAEGKQGSSMSEFLQALKGGQRIDVADLSEQYQLSSGAFLALSRAQMAAGRPDDARRTLVHGVLVLPGDRMLRLALYQLPPQAS